MATSTFGKQFIVKPEKVNDFVEEMTKTAAPTLHRDFHSELVRLSQESNLKKNLLEVLGR